MIYECGRFQHNSKSGITDANWLNTSAAFQKAEQNTTFHERNIETNFLGITYHYSLGSYTDSKYDKKTFPKSKYTICNRKITYREKRKIISYYTHKKVEYNYKKPLANKTSSWYYN